MSLHEIAALDCQSILESADGFGWPVTITDPLGAFADMVGKSNDISAIIDPETGELVEGRTAVIELSLLSLRSEGLKIPANITDSDRKPWLVTFNDLYGTARTFKVIASMPDNTLGFISCKIGVYDDQ